MTQEDKELLLKDLCARLPYGVEASVRGSDEECISFEVLGIKGDLVWVRNKMLLVDHFETIEVIKPYLRPMSSMTEEEKKELLNTILGEDGNQYFSVDVDGNIENTDSEYQDLNNFNLHYVNFNCETVSTYIDWLNAHHFDYRRLIQKGLAIEVPEGMYEKGGKI